MRAHAGTRAVVWCAVVGLAGCDLANLEQKRFCASANDDPAKCASRPDWCIPDGLPECVEAVEGANCSQCAPAQQERAPCSAKPSLSVECRHAAARVKAGVFKPLGEWDWRHLDRELLEPQVNKVLSAATVTAMSDHDRHMLCGPGSGADWTGKGPCVLRWDAEAERADCVLEERFCAASCNTRLRRFQCVPVNLCSGVI